MFRVRIRELREKAGYKSQQSFADAFGVAQTTVAGWEGGKRQPNYETTVRLADFFGVSVDYLIRDSSPAEEIPNRTFSIGTYNPFAALCILYRLTDDEFSEISTMSRSDIDRLWYPDCVDNTITPSRSSVYDAITPFQFQRVSTFFECPVSDLQKDISDIPWRRKPSVEARIDGLSCRIRKHEREIALAYRRASNDDKAVVDAALRKYVSDEGQETQDPTTKVRAQ